MTKLLRCRDVGLDCDFDARADSEDLVIRVIEMHAEAAHDLACLGDDIVDRLRAAVREDDFGR